MSIHAVLSPSSAHRWRRCTGSVELSKDLPDTTSAAAEEGTAAHGLAARVLNGYAHLGAKGYVGMLMENGVAVTESMAEFVQEYVDYVRALPRTHDGLFVEVSMALSGITGEANAVGTADAVILNGDELVVVDLKFGRGEEVEAEDNEQLMMYAVAALRHFDVLGDFKTVRMVIHQPRISSVPKEYVLTVDELAEFGSCVGNTACNIGGGHTSLVVGDKQCRWCKAKAFCPAISTHVQETVGVVFDDITENHIPTPKPENLSQKMAAVELIENWCKAVRGAVSGALKNGEDVKGYKLVKGRKGDRKWADEERAVCLLKSLGLEDDKIYDRSIVSPATVEKYRKTEGLQDDAWERVKSILTQSEGALSVVKATDKRDAVKCDKTIDMFDAAE